MHSVNISKMADVLPAVIPGGISADDVAAITGHGRAVCADMLDEFAKNGIGHASDGCHVFESSDRLAAALLMVSGGAPIDDVAVHLDWRSFEGLAAKILDEKGFATSRNVIITKPRMEIDVIGTSMGVAILVDCKHWSRHSPSTLQEAVRKQVARTRRYVAGNDEIMAVPVVVTLYKDGVDFIRGVPIVPIHQFSSFVDELYGNLGDITLFPNSNSVS